MHRSETAITPGTSSRLVRVMYSGVAIYRARSVVVNSRARENRGGPPALDPGIRRDDVSSGHPLYFQAHWRAFNMHNTIQGLLNIAKDCTRCQKFAGS